METCNRMKILRRKGGVGGRDHQRTYRYLYITHGPGQQWGEGLWRGWEGRGTAYLANLHKIFQRYGILLAKQVFPMRCPEICYLACIRSNIIPYHLEKKANV